MFKKKKKEKYKLLQKHKKSQRSCVQKMATGTEVLVTLCLDLLRPGEWEAAVTIPIISFLMPFISASFHSGVESAALDNIAQK